MNKSPSYFFLEAPTLRELEDKIDDCVKSYSDMRVVNFTHVAFAINIGNSLMPTAVEHIYTVLMEDNG